jgi:prophage DNA circulation protein
MATIQEIAPAPWRMRLLPASFAGVRFHVEQQSRSGGRRVVLHEYPKRDEPYAEDMGRHAFRYQMNGYLVSPDYHIDKRALMRALDNSAGGTLVDPYLAAPVRVMCERYSVTETRERGGYCVFEMAFVELGTSGNAAQETDSKSQVENKASDTADAGAKTVNESPPSSTFDEAGFQ